MWVNFTLNLSPELAEEVNQEAEKHGISRAKYIRAVLRNSTETPFSASDVDLTVDDTDAEESQTGAA